MSRVDDDREAQRVAERLMLQKRQEEKRATSQKGESSTFAKLMNQAQADGGGLAQREAAREHAESRVGQVSERDLDGKSEGDSLILNARKGRASQGARVIQGKASTDRSDQDQGVQRRAAELGVSDQSDVASSEGHHAETRKADDRATEDGLEERGASFRSSADASAKNKGGARTDADGGKGQGGGGGEKKKDGEPVPGFRLNPALMAPVPVAVPKESGGSSRLRQLANEIAQKIVERVRVGTNSLGKAEFQIDLRSSVLAGLSIKVSGGNGKIKAVFSGNDREVLKMLREQSQGLSTALASRGLTLEELPD